MGNFGVLTGTHLVRNALNLMECCFPQKIEFKDIHNNKTETYNTFFQSDILGFRWHEENIHQELCLKVLSKIRKEEVFG